MLYETTTQAAKLGLDVLGLLASCRSNSTQFNTDWASADRTSCPHIPLDARSGDLLLFPGDARIVPSSESRQQWDWGNLRQFGEVEGEVSDIGSIKEMVAGSQTLKYLYLAMICLPVVFFVLHHVVLKPLSPAYRALGADGQLISCQHAVYALVYGLSMVPQTVLAMRAMFYGWTGTYMASVEVVVMVGIFISTRSVLYLIEASVRSVVKWSWLLLVHHMLFFTIVVMALWTQNAAVVGIGFVLDLFACHEAPLYVALLAYRLLWQPKVARIILRSACTWYVLTRIMQTVLLVYMITSYAQLGAVRLAPEFIVTAIFCGAFTFIQAYTLVIYRAMDVNLGKRLAESKADAGVGLSAWAVHTANGASSSGTFSDSGSEGHSSEDGRGGSRALAAAAGAGSVQGSVAVSGGSFNDLNGVFVVGLTGTALKDAADAAASGDQKGRVDGKAVGLDSV